MDAVRPHGLPEYSPDGAATARCPAPSVQQIIAKDAQRPPQVLAHEHYEFMGSEDIPFDRYYDRAFFEREVDRIWGRTWQWVCREDHIPEPGDFYTYEVAHLSFIVVRQTDGGVKAFVNSFLHRGTKLKRGEGTGSGAQLQCPYHGWTWENDGRLKAIPCAWDFKHVDARTFALPEVKTGRWGGFIFINPDPKAPPLKEYLAPLPEHFAAWDMENRYVDLHMAKRLPCNWKTAQEAFLESYHVLATHPQLMAGVGDANVQYDTYGRHVSRFYAASGVNSPHLAKPLSEQELLNTMITGDRGVLDQSMQLGEGETARIVMARFLRKALGEKYQADLSRFSDSEMVDTIEYHVFPNMFLFPGLSLPMVYRFRPLGLDPNRTMFEILFMRPKPASGEAPPPAEPHHLDENDSYASVPGMDAAMGHVYDQDTDNLRAQQQGFRASRKRKQTLGNYQEVRIRHFNKTVDAYLDGGKP